MSARHPIARFVTTLVFLAVASVPDPAVAAPSPGAWLWPVSGPVIEAFDPPDSPFGSGHRGIDIATPVGTDVVAPADGTVTFAGPVGGRRFVTIDHGDGLRSTVSFVEALRVRAGDVVGAGQVVASSGTGHAAEGVPHVHVGVRVVDTYVDPMDYLAPPSVTTFIRLAPCCAEA
ncbi:MAG TPA: M23 family metallopeptidase [Actinomycetota bacterium]|nr:M23 family metallopeptidase [Actinomycetota bacterium]